MKSIQTNNTGSFRMFFLALVLLLVSGGAYSQRYRTYGDDGGNDQSDEGSLERPTRRTSSRSVPEVRQTQGGQPVQVQVGPNAPVQPSNQPQQRMQFGDGRVGAGLNVIRAGDPNRTQLAPDDPNRTQLEQIERAQRLLAEHQARLQEAREKAMAGQEHPVGPPAPVVAPVPPPPGQEPESRPGRFFTFYTTASGLGAGMGGLRVRPGEKFIVDVHLANQSERAFDEIGFALSFDPTMLQVVDSGREMDHSEESLFRGAGSIPIHVNQEADNARGLVSYRAQRRDGGNLTSSGRIASVTFEALVTQEPDTTIQFSGAIPRQESITGEPETGTFIRLGGNDLLNEVGEPLWNVMSSEVRFLPDEATMPRGGQSVLRTQEIRDFGTRIVIWPEQEVVQAGQEFDVFLTLENPDGVAFDEITLFLGYNTEYLTVIDHDRNNYMRGGINIFDGDYHDAFPFNLHRRNSVDRRRGWIVYQKGCIRDRLTSEGTFASIRFRAIRPTTERGTRLQVGFVRDLYFSGLFRKGADVLGRADQTSDGFEVFPIMIAERRVAMEAGVSR